MPRHDCREAAMTDLAFCGVRARCHVRGAVAPVCHGNAPQRFRRAGGDHDVADRSLHELVFIVTEIER